MKTTKQLIALVITAALFIACKKEINYKLKPSEQQLVIEGSVSDRQNPFTVKISKTISPTDNNSVPLVSGATVRISDDAGYSETLTETSPGNYSSTKKGGEVGRNYSINISSNGKDYQGSSIMPAPVTNYTLIIDSSMTDDKTNQKMKEIVVILKDSLSVKNYYRFVKVVNGVTKSNIYVVDDQLRDGDWIINMLYDENSLKTGDSVKVLIQSIDKNVYDYFKTLFQTITSGSNPLGSTPNNPVSNINNKALGYFSAYSEREIFIKVP